MPASDRYQQHGDRRVSDKIHTERLNRLEQDFAMLSEQTAQLQIQGKRQDDGQLEILRVLGEMRKELVANTEVTTQIRSMWTGATWVQKAIVWLGAGAGGLAGFIALWFAFKKDGA